MANDRTTRWARRSLIGLGAAALAGGIAAFGTLWLREGGAIVPGVPRARRVLGSESAPAQADVVVIGGGNIGCMTALSLVERGVSVALCEKGVIAGEASGRSLGYIDNQFLDPIKMPLIGRSKELWRDINSRVALDTGYRPAGVAFFCTQKETLDGAEQWLGSVRGAPGVDAHLIGAREAMSLAGGTADSYVGALYQPSDATVEPQLFAPAVAEAVGRAGGTVLQNCAVRGIERAAGRISGVITERGRIGCKSVVLAGGVWSPIFAQSLGLELPQFMAFSSVMRLVPDAGPAVGTIVDRGGIAMRRTIDGACDACTAVGAVPITPRLLGTLPRLWPVLAKMGDLGGEVRAVLNLSTFMEEWRIPKQWPLDKPSPFESRRILMPETRTRLLAQVLANVRTSFPGFARSRVSERWGGALMSTLDNMPVLSGVADWPGLYLGAGFYYGLTMAPAAGEALADLVTGHAPRFDLTPYRYSRFSDGSKLTFRA
jgi:glycine/D-amino acid oxidase-like deaminating enzyme